MRQSIVLMYKIQSASGMVEEFKEHHTSREGAEIALFNASLIAKKQGRTVAEYNIKPENAICPVVKKLSQTDEKYSSLK